MKIAFIILLLVHGLIHLLGFVKAYNLSEVSQLTQPISRTAGLFWLLSTILFIVSLVLFLLNVQFWWVAAAIAAVLSQILIIQSWTDAKFGTIANLIILIPVVISFIETLPSSFANKYRTEVQKGLSLYSGITSILTENDIKHLPLPVQKYMQYTGVIGKPKVHNFRAVFEGDIKAQVDGNWLGFHSEQYNFLDNPRRVFYLESKMYGIPLDGLHIYAGKNASMEIKAGSIIKVADARGEEMNQGETVTLFNDICLMAPAALINPDIKWEIIDSLTVKAKFTNMSYTISATLYFNEKGELINFISNDRFLSESGKTYMNYPWSTPIKNYKEIEGRKIAAEAETIWHTPDGEFTYGKFKLINIEYNCTELK